MTRKPNIVAFIPARGGSRGIPLKNIAPIGGKPLIYWVARACSGSSALSETCIATENDEIRACAEGLNLERVRIIARSPSTATDEASSESALLEFARGSHFDHVALIQATSPLLTSADIDGAIESYITGGYDSLLTVVRTKRFLWKADKKGVVPVNYDPARRPRRQEWDGQLVENGALYLSARKRLLESSCRLSGRIGAYEMAAESYFELDDADDWRYLDFALRARLRSDGFLTRAARRIKLLCVDVDGTLTDGGMYYAENGEVMKRFNTTDALGMRLLREQGIDLAIITAEKSPIVLSRAKKLRIHSVHLGVKDKEACVEGLLKQHGLGWQEIAYVGDDINDLGVLRRSGLSACPADASNEVRAISHYVCTRAGGRGAVREVCDLILSMRSTT